MTAAHWSEHRWRYVRESVWIVLRHGAHANVQSNEKVTPLHFALVKRELAVTRVLLEHGADVNAQDRDDQTPLYWAQGEEVSRVLLEHGADANALDIKGRTLLHQASESGRLGTTRVLLEHGVDVNSRDANHATSLHLASRPWYRNGGHLDVIQLLL
jgi:ankyrin repeat protein